MFGYALQLIFFYFIHLGNYNWSPEKLKSAHQSCLDKLVFAMKSGVDLVCQHNVNAQRWNSEELQRNAELLGIPCHIIFFLLQSTALPLF